MAKPSSNSRAGIVKRFGLTGFVIGVVFFILSFIGVNIPIVINSTSYEGVSSALMLLLGCPLIMLIIGINIWTA